jgi:hydroxymethylglutaryl-CoA reductase
MGIPTGIAILSNYCLERRALAWFEMDLKEMSWKGIPGEHLAEKIIEAY